MCLPPIEGGLVDHALCSYCIPGCRGIPWAACSKLVELSPRQRSYWLLDENFPLVSYLTYLYTLRTFYCHLSQSLCACSYGHQSPSIWSGDGNKTVCLLHIHDILCTWRNSYSLLLPSGMVWFHPDFLSLYTVPCPFCSWHWLCRSLSSSS